MKKSLLLLIVFSVLFVSPAIAEPPIDPGNSGSVNFIGREPMTMRWKRHVDYDTEELPCATNGKHVLVVSGQYSVVCLDAETGNQLWKRQTVDYVKYTPCVTSTIGLVTSKLGYIQAFDLERGEQKFLINLGFDELTTPVIGENYVFLKGLNHIARTSSVMAIDLYKGKVVGKYIQCGYSLEPPVLSQKEAFTVTPDRKGIQAISQSTLLMMWTKNLDDEVTHISTRMNHVVAVCRSGNIYAIENATGNIVWKSSVAGPVDWPATISVDHVIVCSGSNKVHSFRLSDGTQLWEKHWPVTVQPQSSRAYDIFCFGKTMSFHDPKNGEKLWQLELPSETIGQPIPFLDQIFAATRANKIIALRTAGFEISLSSRKLDLGSIPSNNPYGMTQLTVRNNSGEPQQIFTSSSSPWISVSHNGFEIMPFEQVDVAVEFDMHSLTLGESQGDVIVAWNNGSIKVDVLAKKIGEKEIIPPKPGFLSLGTTEIKLEGRLNMGTPLASITLFNKGELPVSYNAKSEVPWVVVGKSSGRIYGNTSTYFTATIINDLASIGENTAEIYVTCPETGQSFIVPVKYIRNLGRTHVILQMRIGSTVGYLGQTKIRIRPEPFIENSSIIVPLEIFKLALDATLDEYEYTFEPTYYVLQRGDIKITHRLGESRVFIQEGAGETKEMLLPCPSRLVNGRPVVPLLGIAMALRGEMIHSQMDGRVTLDVFLPELPAQR
ncbi:MAG: PQQ-binding-like beta-propeller repeat protein [Caldisericales bacterium]|nr:PQQ-binding-like beta-propeller repeat protein [Caldisericales bacterium]